MCEIGDLDPCSAWSETWRTANKLHRCDACRGAIARGERYLVHFSVFEGDVTSEKMCVACDRARGAFCQAHLDGQVCPPSTFSMFLTECLNDPEDPTGHATWGPMLAEMKAREAARVAA